MNKEEIIAKLREIWQYGDPMFYEIIVELCQLHNDKNRHYATKEDPLQNFYRVGEWLKKYQLVTEGWEPVKVALIYCLKQIDAVLKLLGENKEELFKGTTESVEKIEGIEGRLNDIAVYMMLARIIYRRLLEG